jgi:rhamnulokinase
VEASALGNLCAQMIAMGEIAGLDEARALIRHSFKIEEYRPQEPVPDSIWKQFKQYAVSSAEEAVR